MDVNGVYKPTYNWGGPHCDHFPYEMVIFMGIPHESTSVTRRHRKRHLACVALLLHLKTSTNVRGNILKQRLNNTLNKTMLEKHK